MRKISMMLLLLALAGLVSASWAAEDYALSDSVASQLNEEARKDYVKGLVHLNHINYFEALRSFISAQHKAPQSVELRLLTGKLAFDEAEKKMGLHPVTYPLYKLSESELASISDEARKLYLEGLNLVNLFDFEGAYNKYYEALQRSPENEALSALVDKLDEHVTEHKIDMSMADSAQLFGIARASYQQIVDLRQKGERVRRTDATMAEGRIRKIDEILANMEKHNENRIKVGAAVLNAYAKDIGQDAESRAKRKEEEAKAKEREKERLLEAKALEDTGAGTAGTTGQQRPTRPSNQDF